MRLLLALPIAALVAASPAKAATLTAEYALSLVGLPVGQATLTAKLDGNRYHLDLSARLTGIAALAGGKGGASADGALGGPRPLPSGFTVAGRSGKSQQRVVMTLASGNVGSVDVVPPYEPKPDRVPLQDGHKRGIVDPLSALLMPVQGVSDPLDPANCNRTIPVFDSAARFDIVLSYAETRDVRKAGYDGRALVCNVRYVPVAGHRALRPVTKFMQDNKDMSVWLVPVAGTRVLLPIRIGVMTTIGMSVIEAESWRVEGLTRASLGD